MTASKEIRARFSKCVIEPLEELDLDDGEEILISIVEAPQVERTLRALGASAGQWTGTHDPEGLKRNIYEHRSGGSRPELRL